VVARRLVVWCCGGGAPVEAYDDYGMRMFDTTPLSGHEEFWVTHRDAVTQCLMTFDGHISVDGMRQLVEDRLLIDGTSCSYHQHNHMMSYHIIISYRRP